MTTRATDPLTGEVRIRVPLPLLIPLSAVVVIAALAIGFAAVLLAIPSEAATVVAIAMALNILGACAVIALRPDLGRSAYAELAIVVLYPVLIGAVLSQVNLGAGDHGGAGGGAVPAGFTQTVTAEGSQFDTDTIRVPAGEPYDLEFVNNDPIQHNIVVFAGSDASGEQLFRGDLISGGSTTYSLPALDPGEYFFHCEVHPGMQGTLVAEQAQGS